MAGTELWKRIGQMRYAIVKKDEFHAALAKVGMKPGQFAEFMGLKPNTVSSWGTRDAIPYWLPYLLAAWKLLWQLGYKPPRPEGEPASAEPAVPQPDHKPQS